MYDLFSAPDTGSGSAATATIARRQEPTDAGRLFERAVIVHLELSRLGVRRKVNARDVNATDAAPELLHVSKSILESPELAAIATAHGELRRFVASRASGPAFLNRGGFHLLAVDLVEETDNGIQSRVETIRELVQKFTEVYEQRAAETRARLGTLAPDVNEYPPLSVVREQFGAAWRYLTFSTPNTLQGIRRDIFEREREKAAAEWGAALDECKQVLRAAFADLVAHLADRMSARSNSRFDDSALTRFEDFAATFAQRNLADDQDLADLVTRARDILAGVSAKDLKTQQGLRDDVARNLADVKRDLEPLIVDRPTRMYTEE